MSSRRRVLTSSFSVPTGGIEQHILERQYLIEGSALKFNTIKPIGQGASATVFRGIYFGGDVAVKKYTAINGRTHQHLLAKEAAELIKLSHQNIV